MSLAVGTSLNLQLLGQEEPVRQIVLQASHVLVESSLFFRETSGLCLVQRRKN